jgi:hypothetical protein
MVKSLFNQAAVARYREAATELHNLRVEVGQRIESAIVEGNNQAARSALEELKASGEAFQELRSTLTARDLFVAKYNIQVHGPHEVSFVLPKGVSRFEMLREAQGLVDDRKLVWPDQLKEWQDDSAFQKSSDTPERIRIDGHVEGGDAKDRTTQEALVGDMGRTLPSLEDLAAAFVAHYVATGEPLFGWFDNSSYTFVVRAAGGALNFGSDGLNVYGIDDGRSSSYVAVAALVPRNSKN